MNNLYREMAIANIKRALHHSDAANKIDNSVLKGRAREIFVSDLLKPFLSPSMDICTGTIIDAYGNHSKQIDVIIYNRNIVPASMLTVNEGIVPYESVLSTVEVKTKLNSTELRSCIENSRSIKTLNPFFAEMKKGSPDKGSPACFVFAYSSDLKSNEELLRLSTLVDKSNENSNDKVYVPISGICIARHAFIYCTSASKTPKFIELYNEDECISILKFLVSIIEISNHLSLEREPIFIRPYLLDDELDYDG